MDAGESGLGDADDLIGALFDLHPLTDDARIAAETARPEGMADHGGLMRADGPVVRGSQQPAERGCDAQHVEGIARHELRADLLLDAAGIGQDRLPERLMAHAEHVHAGRGRLAEPIEERVAEERREACMGLRADAVEHDEAGRIADRQLAEDQGVDEREGGRDGADGEAERDDGGGGDDGVLAQQPQAEAHVAPEGFEPVQELDVAARFAHQESASELLRSSRGGSLTRHAARHEVVGARLDVELLFLFDLARQPIGAHHIDESRPPGHIESSRRGASPTSPEHIPDGRSFVSDAIEHVAHRERHRPPACFLRFELLAAGVGHLVDAGAPLVRGHHPFRFHPACLFEPMERRIQRSLLDPQHFGRDRFDLGGNRVSVQRSLPRQNLEDQHGQSALKCVAASHEFRLRRDI